MNSISYRIEIKHNCLLFKTECLMGLSNNCINILVDSLLKVKVVARNFLDVFLDVCHGNHTFAQFKS
jgi:hypothetical protein